ncbi:MAG: nitrilase-related carbon-nitrogen hydrolase [Candidatus Gastranaerophilales bacterium]
MDNAGILTLQFNPKLNDKKANLDKVYDLVSQYCDKQIDLVVLPEFFSTGIDDNAFKNSAEPVDGGETIGFLKNVAKRFNTNIVCGTVIVKDGENLYNTAFVLNRRGEIVNYYRKIHLYNYFGGNEGNTITAGVEALVVDLDFAKVGVSVCFDIKFPMLYRKLIKMGAEIIVSPSAWCNLNILEEKQKLDYVTTWRAMNICRATESLVYFVSSNQVGKSNKFLYCCGNSMIVAPMGEVLQNACDKEDAIYAQISLKKVRELKINVPVAQLE